jgi:hypothetical protein
VFIVYLLVTRNPTSLQYHLQMAASGGTAAHSAIKLYKTAWCNIPEDYYLPRPTLYSGI